MQQAEGAVTGTHDFASFAAQEPDRNARKTTEASSTVRTLFASQWTEESDLLVYRVAGSGFLHHMVRNLVGTFVEIGTGRRAANSVAAVLAARNRSAAGMTAPPQGLTLTRVVYRGDVGADRFSAQPAEVSA